MLSEAQQRIILERLAALDPGLVYVFGSVAENREHPESDIDLAFLSSTPQDPVRVFDLAQDLAIALNRDVDLVDLQRASTVMAKEVYRTGRLLFRRDAGTQHWFEMRTLSDYARLNEERAPILRP